MYLHLGNDIVVKTEDIVGIFDLDNNIQTAINNEEEYIVKMKVKFNKNIDEPIFAMSFTSIVPSTS